MEVSGQLHTPAALPPGERGPRTNWIGGWVGPRADLDAVAKRKKKSPITALATDSRSVLGPTQPHIQ
jgi:hypothetical protein